jgi:glyoxylase-like metal-dependent hydrolase (beta-lactamase superfamily II)
MAHYTIRPVSTGSFAEAETSLLYYLADDRNAGVKIPAVYWMFVVSGPGGLAIVDTGPGEPEVWKQQHHFYDRTPDQEPIAALRRLGIAPEDVDVVINTHLHWDHCHANHLFPNAVIRVQAREIIEAMDPVPAHRGFYTPLNRRSALDARDSEDGARARRRRDHAGDPRAGFAQSHRWIPGCPGRYGGWSNCDRR